MSKGLGMGSPLGNAQTAGAHRRGTGRRRAVERYGTCRDRFLGNTVSCHRRSSTLGGDHSSDALGDISEGGILARPFAAYHRLAIARQGLQLGEAPTLPEAGTQNDRYYLCRPGFVSFHRPLEFDVVNVVRSEKVGADQQ